MKSFFKDIGSALGKDSDKKKEEKKKEEKGKSKDEKSTASTGSTASTSKTTKSTKSEVSEKSSGGLKSEKSIKSEEKSSGNPFSFLSKDKSEKSEKSEKSTKDEEKSSGGLKSLFSTKDKDKSEKSSGGAFGGLFGLPAIIDPTKNLVALSQDVFPAKASYIQVPTGNALGEKGGDLISGIKKIRKFGKKSTAEKYQLDKLRRVWVGVYGPTDIPPKFLDKKEKEKKKKKKGLFSKKEEEPAPEGEASEAGEKSEGQSAKSEKQSEKSEAQSESNVEEGEKKKKKGIFGGIFKKKDKSAEEGDGDEEEPEASEQSEKPSEGGEGDGDTEQTTKGETDEEEDDEPEGDDAKEEGADDIDIEEVFNPRGFQDEALEIVEIIQAYQRRKEKGDGVEFTGYPDDPENLFLNEFKIWAKVKFANSTEKDRSSIQQRMAYLEDALIKDGLFDRPGSDDRFTVQKVIVEVRRVLRRTLKSIETRSSVISATRSVNEILDSLRKFLDVTMSILWLAFLDQCVPEGQAENSTKIVRFHKAVLASPQLRLVLPQRAKLGVASSGKTVGFSENGNLAYNNECILQAPVQAPTGRGAATRQVPLTEITSENQYAAILSGIDSGLEKSFRDNAPVGKLYMEAYAFASELGAVYGIFRKAKEVAISGGTTLLYGAANAHFNAVLELCDRLTDGMRTRLATIVDLCESRFEELVEINWATVTRCPWIGNYQQLPRLFIEAESLAAEIFKFVSKARGEANAVLLSKKRPQGDDEDDAEYFVNESELVTRNAEKYLQISFNSLKSYEAATKTSKKVANVTQLMKARETSAKEAEREAATRKQKEFLEQHLVKTATSGAKLYMIALTTSKLPGSGTDAGVYCVINGVNGKTARCPLPDEDKSCFEIGNIDRFDIEVNGDIGEIISVTLGLDAGAGQLDADWRVGGVEILDKSAGKRYVFPIKDHITLGGIVHSKEKTIKLQ